METKGLSGRMFNLGSGGGMLGLEMPLQPPPGPASQNPNHHHHLQPQPPPTQNQIIGFSHHEADNQQPQTQLPMKQTYSFLPKSTHQTEQRLNSDDDEPGCTKDDDSSADGKRKNSPWQRMKWTDSMVRLLIMVVYYIGDEFGSDIGNDKKKSAGGLLQKKGKWKSVSQAMLEKGFYVSPQQCEDKFNDLNKRYKRVIDIFGKGTACKVVENQSLLDTMDLSSKTKEEARKLLNSKHLFFREMCAYHTSCGHGGQTSSCGGSGMHQSPEVMGLQAPANPQQQQCFHATENRAMLPVVDRGGAEESSKLVVKGESGEDEDDFDVEDVEDDFEDDERDEWDPGAPGPRKMAKEEVSMPSSVMRQFRSEIFSALQDGTKSPVEKKQWIMTRLTRIEEQGVKYQYEAFQIEKQRLKWLKFSGRKQLEIDRMKLDNERRRLENERMLILLRQKELELLDQHHAQNPSPVTG